MASFLDVKAKCGLIFLVLRVILDTTHACTLPLRIPDGRWADCKAGRVQQNLGVRSGRAGPGSTRWGGRVGTASGHGQPSKERRGHPLLRLLQGHTQVVPLSLCTLGVLSLPVGRQL